MKRNCKRLFRMHFDLTYYPIFQHQQMICSLDCYQHFRHQYEYVTNYDFDELILPRRRGYNFTHDLERLEQVQCPQNTTTTTNTNTSAMDSMIDTSRREHATYKLYDYASDLFARYGRHMAYVKFNQVAFFNDPASVLNSVRRALTQDGHNESTVHQIKVWLDNRFIAYNIYARDEAFLRAFRTLNETIACLNSFLPSLSSTNSSNMSSTVSDAFRLLLATELQIVREGKSIYNTDYTETYDAHEAKALSDTSGDMSVPAFRELSIDDGFVSHFRDYMGKYFDKSTYPFSYIKLDLDYFMFLINLAKS